MTDYEKWNKYCAELSSSSNDESDPEDLNPQQYEVEEIATEKVEGPSPVKKASVEEVFNSDENSDEIDFPENVEAFLWEVMYEISGGENALTKSQLLNFTSLAYPDQSESDVASMIDDLVAYCGLKEPFQVVALIDNYCIAWDEDRGSVMKEVFNLGKYFVSSFKAYFGDDSESEEEEEEVEESEEDLDEESEEIDYIQFGFTNSGKWTDAKFRTLETVLLIFELLRHQEFSVLNFDFLSD